MRLSLVEKIKTKTEITNLLIAKNKKVLHGYTVGVIRILTYLSCLIMAGVSAITFLPIDFMRGLQFKIISLSFLAAFIFLSLCFFVFKNFSEKFSTPLSYAVFSLLFLFALEITLATNSRPPYATVIGFFIIMPIIIYDKRWRVNLTNVIFCATALVLSFFFKKPSYFYTDCINCAIFTVVGNLIGNFTLVNQLNYIDMKEGKLDRDLEILKAKSEAKTSFLANMSHEIRTPINSIIGFNEMILRECKDEKILAYSNDILVASKTLLSIINDILDFSRIEAGKLDITPVEYALDSMTSDMVSMILPRAKEKNLSLVVNVDKDIPNALYGDESRIKQCVMNLLTNAVKYTKAGTVTLNVGFERLDKNTLLLKFSVVDTGIGIKPENIDKLFQAFERIDEKKNRNVEGTGLGMKIVQLLLGKMDTYLDVKSEYGKGSEFSFAVEQDIVSDEPIGAFSERYKKLQERHENYVELFQAPAASVLIVDDVPINLAVARNLLKSTHVRIDTALSGRQAIDLVRQKKYDMIFLDHRMPDLDGVETCQMMMRMRDNLNKDTPIIALTANAIAGAREMFLENGFKDYLTKPIDNKLLEKMMIKYLPPELVTRTYIRKDSEAGKKEERAKDESGFMRAYRALDGIDADEALKNCGDEATLETAARDYYNSIEEKSAAIENFARDKDWKNYTVLVHALKSSSRLVGAMQLSGLAAHLEKCGDRALVDEIIEETPELLAQYRSYISVFEGLLSLGEGAPDGRASAKPRMTAQKYSEALAAIKECAEAFDFDAAESVVKSVEAYDVPQGAEDAFEKIKKAVRAADTEAVVRLSRRE